MNTQHGINLINQNGFDTSTLTELQNALLKELGATLLNTTPERELVEYSDRLMLRCGFTLARVQFIVRQSAVQSHADAVLLPAYTSRSGKRQNAIRKAPNRFKESSSAQQGKHSIL